MASTVQIYAVATISGRLIWHTFSQWEERCIHKFCPWDDWPKWQAIGYHVRRLLLVDTTQERPWSEVRKEHLGEETLR